MTWDQWAPEGRKPLRGEGVVRFRRAIRDVSDGTFFPTLILLVTVIIGFNGLWRLLDRYANLPESAYASGSILVGGLTSAPFAILLVVPAFVLALGWDELSWAQLDHGDKLRLLVMMVAFPVVWSAVTTGYNPYFDQWYHVDRILIVVLYALIWIHPWFAYFTFFLLYAFQGQFFHPFGHLSRTSGRLPQQFLTLFCAYLFLNLRKAVPFKDILHSIGAGRLTDPELPDGHVFVWAAAGLIGGSYFVPGTNKLVRLWPVREQLAHFIPFSYLRGWMWYLEPDQIKLAFDLVSTVNPLLTWGTILIEVGIPIYMWRKWTMGLAIGGVILLHLSIFAITGILFKKWIVVVGAFLLFVYLIENDQFSKIFTRRTAIVVTVLILSSSLIFPLSSLYWYQTNVDRTYTMEAVTEEGVVYDIDWTDMSPYGITFKQNRFEYLDQHRIAEGARETTDYSIYQQLLSATDPEDIVAIRNSSGVVRYDESKAEAFDRFIREYFQSYQCQRGGETFFTALQPPPHLFWKSGSDTPLPAGNVSEVRIKKTTYLFTDGNIQEVDEKVVRTIDIDTTVDCSVESG